MVEFLHTLWTRTSVMGRILFALGSFCIVIGVVWLFLWANQEDYQPLFTDMAEQDAMKVVEQLDKQKITYKVAQDGKTILVERSIVPKTRMQLMGGDLALSSGVGLELFNNSELGMTEFTQKINYQRALQGELARTITGFDEVQAARVHLVLPENGFLRRKESNAKASVWVTLRGDNILKAEQVNGIQRLVAASVPGIKPSVVTVIDHKGVALSINDHYADNYYVGNANLQLKKEVESYFSNKIAKVLDEALGPKNVAIAVDATLDYGQVQTTRETVLPASDEKSGVLVRKKERSSGSEIVLSQSNQTNSKDAALPPIITEPISKMVESDFQNGKEIQKILTAPGAIKRLNVGVILPKKLPAETMEHIQQVVTMAVGLDVERGDALAFSSIDPLASEVNDSIVVPSLITSTDNKQSSFVGNKELLIVVGAIVGAVLIFLSLTLIILHHSKKNSRQSNLSETDRERILAYVKKCLQDSASSEERQSNES